MLALLQPIAGDYNVWHQQCMLALLQPIAGDYNVWHQQCMLALLQVIIMYGASSACLHCCR